MLCRQKRLRSCMLDCNRQQQLRTARDGSTAKHGTPCTAPHLQLHVDVGERGSNADHRRFAGASAAVRAASLRRCSRGQQRSSGAALPAQPQLDFWLQRLQALCVQQRGGCCSMQASTSVSGW